MALAVAGENLYLGGAFTEPGGGGSLPHIARWDGSSWHSLGAGLDGHVSSIVAVGPALYAGSSFTGSEGTTLNHIARWDGSL